MANQKQLDILKRGKDAWNEWRKHNPRSPIDLSGANLEKANLHGMDLSGSDPNPSNVCILPVGNPIILSNLKGTI